MERASVNGVELEYEVTGTGEPVLLISPVLADGFLPLVSEPLLDRYQLIRYHKRGWVGSTHTEGPVGISDHAADAAALLDHLNIERAHVVGHSSGAAVAAELALIAPARVATLSLLELSIFSVPSGPGFLEGAAPVFEAYARGEHEEALSMFLGAVSGLDWPACRTLLEERMPGSVAQAIKDADTFFGVELPALGQWTFGAAEAAAINQPVLSMLGGDTGPLWIEVAEFLRSSNSHVEDVTIPGLGHLLHIEQPEPVARELAAFLTSHPIT
ncbi:MAG TPA: alpha/beta hydrolase [Acidimicrobiales bacterium]|nr:alpha/beta hydrolase [Acidimicrobiales bacterium]